MRPTLTLDLGGDGRRWALIYDLLMAELASAERPGRPSPASAAAEAGDGTTVTEVALR